MHREPLAVLTTVYPVSDIVKQIGGERVRVEWFIESGQPLDPITPTADRRQQWLNASLVVTRGLIDPWTFQGVGDAYQDRRILRVDLLPAAQSDDSRSYFWLDPQVAVELAREVTERLSALEPSSEALFRRNLKQFTGHVESLADAAKAKIHRGAGFVSLDPGFAPLAARFGLKPVRLGSDIDPAQPGNESATELRQLASQSGAGAVFANADVPPALLQDWQTHLDMPVLTLDALGTSAPSGRHTYLELLRYNLQQLERQPGAQ